MLELLGTQENGIYRFEITMDLFDTSALKPNDVSENFYDGITIPLKRSDSNYFTYDEIFNLLASEAIYPVFEQASKLDLFIRDDDESDERLYFICANVLVDDGEENTYQMIEINLDENEIEVVKGLMAVRA